MTLETLEDGSERFVTAGGVTITRQRHDTPYAGSIEAYVDGLNGRRGAGPSGQPVPVGSCCTTGNGSVPGSRDG